MKSNVTKNKFSLLTWLQLMRLPTVFTALSNILCGFLLTHLQPRLKVADLTGHSDLWLLLASTHENLFQADRVLSSGGDHGASPVRRLDRVLG